MSSDTLLINWMYKPGKEELEIEKEEMLEEKIIRYSILETEVEIFIKEIKNWKATGRNKTTELIKALKREGKRRTGKAM